VDGPPVACNWTAAGRLSPWLPWLAILALLALKPNRGWSAWWIWLPLVILAAARHGVQLALQNAPADLPEGTLGVCLDVPVSLAFGLAAVWLLAYRFGAGRLGTFLGVFAVLAAFIVFGFSATAGWGLVREPIMGLLNPRQFAATAAGGELATPILVLLMMLALVVAAALALCGLACRGRHRPFQLYLWLLLSVPAVGIAVPALLHYLCRMASPGSMDFPLFLVLGPLTTLVAVATLLPFLILSSVNPFYRERLKALLHVKAEAPAAIAPLPDAR
jgi:hypothetical protein